MLFYDTSLSVKLPSRLIVHKHGTIFIKVIFIKKQNLRFVLLPYIVMIFHMYGSRGVDRGLHPHWKTTTL